MARRRGRFGRARRGGFGRRSRGGRGGSRGGNIGGVLIAGGLYGAVRGYAINGLSSITAQLQSPYAIPAVLGLGGYLLAKHTSGIASDVGRAALTVEAANVGHMAIGSTAAQSTTKTTSPSFGGWV